jgi:hypothetical protein
MVTGLRSVSSRRGRELQLVCITDLGQFLTRPSGHRNSSFHTDVGSRGIEASRGGNPVRPLRPQRPSWPQASNARFAMALSSRPRVMACRPTNHGHLGSGRRNDDVRTTQAGRSSSGRRSNTDDWLRCHGRPGRARSLCPGRRATHWSAVHGAEHAREWIRHDRPGGR